MSLNLQDPNVQQMILRWCKGDEDAARLVIQMATLAREVDDLVDVGGDVQDRASTILELSLIHIAGNPFFMRFNGVMSAVIFEMITYWRLGDQFQNSNDEKKQMFGFVYRESTDRIAVVIAGLLGGTDHAKSVAEEVYEATHAQSKETLADWLAEKQRVEDGHLS